MTDLDEHDAGGSLQKAKRRKLVVCSAAIALLVVLAIVIGVAVGVSGSDDDSGVAAPANDSSEQEQEQPASVGTKLASDNATEATASPGPTEGSLADASDAALSSVGAFAVDSVTTDTTANSTATHANGTDVVSLFYTVGAGSILAEFPARQPGRTGPIEMPGIQGAPVDDALVNAMEATAGALAVFATDVSDSVGPGRRLLDNPGCDKFADNRCTLPCCAGHDECYDTNACSAPSWLETIDFIVGLSSPATACDNCNIDMLQCLLPTYLPNEGECGLPFSSPLGCGVPLVEGMTCYDARCGGNKFYDCENGCCDCASPCYEEEEEEDADEGFFGR